MNRLNSTAAKELLKRAVKRTCFTLQDEANRIEPDHWNESVFRYHIIRNLIEMHPKLDCRTEWKKIDLMIPAEDGVVLVELKFYSRRPTRDHEYKLLGWKGGAGAKNYRESLAVLEKLAENVGNQVGHLVNAIAGRVLVLAYLDHVDQGRVKTFGSYYEHISTEMYVTNVTKIAKEIPVGGSLVLSCLIIEVDKD